VGPEIYTPSRPWLIAPLSSGQIAYLTADLRLLTDRFTGELHLSVIDPSSRRACADARVNSPADAWPLAAIRGDTVFVLTQEITGATLRTIIREYTIGTAGCRWSQEPARKH
jgi:hypothetical protein